MVVVAGRPCAASQALLSLRNCDMAVAARIILNRALNHLITLLEEWKISWSVVYHKIIRKACETACMNPDPQLPRKLEAFQKKSIIIDICCSQLGMLTKEVQQ